ncbi:hypothetical protein ACWAUC_11090 [Bradyrhizobium guangdongense]
MAKDAFDQWWEWAQRPADSELTIPARLHDVVMVLSPEERRNRDVVNETVRTGRSPLRPPGSADQYGVPLAVDEEIVSPSSIPDAPDQTAQILQALYAHEINFAIVAFWDSGFLVKLGDELNGFDAIGRADKFADAVEWLLARAVERYPSLEDPREWLPDRRFSTPTIGSS